VAPEGLFARFIGRICSRLVVAVAVDRLRDGPFRGRFSWQYGGSQRLRGHDPKDEGERFRIRRVHHRRGRGRDDQPESDQEFGGSLSVPLWIHFLDAGCANIKK